MANDLWRSRIATRALPTVSEARATANAWLIAHLPEGEQDMQGQLLCTTVVGSYPQPEWLIDREEEATFYTGGLKLHLTEDFRESAQAFVEKRPANFKGR